MTERNSHSHKEFFYDDRMPGDIEVYTFDQPRDCSSIFCSLQYSGKEEIEDLPVDIGVIVNEKAIANLLTTHVAKRDALTEKKNNAKKKPPLIQEKSLKDTLNRIARYNNKRKSEERFGFGSTLFMNAEEIGVINTVKFLLKTIEEHLANDIKEIKLIMLPQLISIAKFIATKKEGYEAITDILLPVVHKLLMDTDPEVSIRAAEALANMAELLTSEDRREHILIIVLSKYLA